MPEESPKLKVLDLFSGITTGGFSLGLERAGMETIAFCEIEEYPRKILAKHWPDVPIYEDVRHVTKERLDADGIFPDVITGGFPCQDISIAGRQAGIGEGTRSGLWSECARILGEFRPRYAIFENVTALLSGERGEWFQQVLWDISQVGYDAEWHCISASELGAHHHRDRVWIIAYPQSLQRNGGDIYRKHTERQTDREQLGGSDSEANVPNSISNRKRKFRERGAIHNELRECQAQECRRDKLKHGAFSDSSIPNPNSTRLQRCQELGIFGEGGERWQKLITGRFCGFPNISQIEPVICGKTDGIPGYAHRLKGLGNAVVPQIPEIIGRAIMEVENASDTTAE